MFERIVPYMHVVSGKRCSLAGRPRTAIYSYITDTDDMSDSGLALWLCANARTQASRVQVFAALRVCQRVVT